MSGVGFSIPNEQKVVYRLTPMEGRLFGAEALGQHLIAIAKVLKSAGKDAIPGSKWDVAVVGISTGPKDGTIEFELLTALLTKKAGE